MPEHFALLLGIGMFDGPFVGVSSMRYDYTLRVSSPMVKMRITLPPPERTKLELVRASLPRCSWR